MVETPHRRRRSHRRVRTRVYVEGPDGGVTERANNVAAEGEREVWVQVGDAADAATREDYADALLDLHSTPRESIDVGVGGHAHQAYADYAPGDTVAAEGHDQMRTARAESITMRLGDQVDTDVTLTSRAQLQIEDLETLLERMGDASRAANPSLQKRHGLISADKIESGRIRVDQDIASSNFSSGSSGWRVRGNGNAEFNDVIVRGEIHASSGSIDGSLSLGGSLSGSSWVLDSSGYRTATFGGRVEITEDPGYQVDLYNGDGTLTGRIAASGSSATGFGIQARTGSLSLGTDDIVRVRAAPFETVIGWADIHANDFVTESNPDHKRNMRPAAAPAAQGVGVYRYTDSRGRERIGWSADEVPEIARRVHTDEDGTQHRQVSLADMAAMLWARVADIEQHLEVV